MPARSKVMKIGIWGMICGVLGAPSPCADFVRGDADGNGTLGITDPIAILAHVAGGQQPGLECLDAADADDSGAVNVTDAAFIVASLFQGAAAPPAPFPTCGPDPTDDGLGCDAYSQCPVAIGGIPLLGDGIFYVVDKSPTMADSGELNIAKREVIRTINELPEDHQFGIVFFDSSVMKFPGSGVPAMASAAMKAAATSFVQSVTAVGGSCVQQGLVAALNMARNSSARRDVLVYVGDGGGTCQGADEATYLRQTLQWVTEKNSGHAQIHAVGVLSPNRIPEDFMKALAAQNSGIYARIER
jgi:hypothetical protein